MKRLILLNHEDGSSHESFIAEDMKKIIAGQIEDGTDLENLSLYLATDLRIEEVTTTEVSYKLTPLKWS